MFLNGCIYYSMSTRMMKRERGTMWRKRSSWCWQNWLILSLTSPTFTRMKCVYGVINHPPIYQTLEQHSKESTASFNNLSVWVFSQMLPLYLLFDREYINGLLCKQCVERFWFSTNIVKVTLLTQKTVDHGLSGYLKILLHEAKTQTKINVGYYLWSFE